MKIWVGIIHNNEQQPIKKIPEREVKAATRHGTYRIAPNFRGTKFSRIGLLQIFAEINFADQGFPLATPSTIYSQSQQRHARLLASCFWLNFSRAFLVRSFELINYASQAGDASQLTNPTSAVEETYDSGPPGIWKRSL